MKLVCIDKAHQSILENPMAKNWRHIQRTDQNSPQHSARKDCMSSKEKHRCSILAGFNPRRFQDEEMRQNSTKNANIIHAVSNQFWNPIANISVKVQYEKSSTKNRTHRWNNFSANNDATIFTKAMKKKGYPISYIHSEQHLGTRSKTCMLLEKFKFFLNFAVQNHISGTSRATNEHVQFLIPNKTFKKNYCGNRSRTSKGS